MTDFTSNAPRVRSKSNGSKREFYAYFAIIFVAVLPLSFLTWGLTAIRQLSLPEKGPVKRAWSQARIITPMIFTA